MLSSVLAVPWSRKRDERATVEYDGKSKIKVFLLFGASSVGWVRRHLIQVDYKGSPSSSPDTLSAIFPTIPFFFAFACWESEDKEAMTRAMAHRRTILHRGIIFSFFFPYTSWGDNVLRGKKNSNITNHSRKCEYKHATTMLCTRLECWVSNKDALWCRLTAKFGDQHFPSDLAAVHSMTLHSAAADTFSKPPVHSPLDESLLPQNASVFWAK